MTKDGKEGHFKILLVGDSDTGKTNLLSRLTKNEFNLKSEPTSGVFFDTHDFVMDSKTVKIEIWDLAGREKYRAMASSLFHGAAGVLLVYDISNYATFENLTRWLKEIRKFADPKTVILLVGNKSDVEYQRTVPIEEAEKFSADNGLLSIETSAFDASNVKAAFQCIVAEICAEIKPVTENSNDFIRSTTTGEAISDILPSSLNNHKSSSDNDSDQQQKPFHIALVDIRRTAREKVIHCVEKPLVEGKDLKFIAVSYRWGEVQEQSVNTELGYLASVTSFHLSDFYFLCEMMTKEPDLKSMDYVWVDAICVNQTNYELRKATIYQMTNIYKCANYIVAVPDLHLHYLKDAHNTASMRAIYYISEYNEYIYHLIHNKVDELVKLNEIWLDKMNVPKDPALRQMLAKNTDLFVNRLKKYKGQDSDDDSEDAFDYIQNAILNSHGFQDNQVDNENYTKSSSKNESIHRDWSHCLLKEVKNDEWKQSISERVQEITQAMDFLTYLIKDWSSRAWVISEYNIAKNKNSRKMKYWFLSLLFVQIAEFGFFEFDFDTTAQKGKPQKDLSIKSTKHDILVAKTDIAYKNFKNIMTHQLNQRSFLEMMLKSKASKSEDRFHAILPSSKYKDNLESKNVVDSWNIKTMVSVKLKLYEWMNTKDKLDLLFLSATHTNEGLAFAFPTFATLDIRWRLSGLSVLENDAFPGNFELANLATIKLIQANNALKSIENEVPHCKLNLRPNVFYSLRSHDMDTDFIWFLHRYKNLWKHLHVDVDNDLCSLVCIPRYVGDIINHPDLAGMPAIYLVGSLEKNKWVISTFFISLNRLESDPQKWTIHYNDSDSSGFDIY